MGNLVLASHSPGHLADFKRKPISLFPSLFSNPRSLGVLKPFFSFPDWSCTPIPSLNNLPSRFLFILRGSFPTGNAHFVLWMCSGPFSMTWRSTLMIRRKGSSRKRWGRVQRVLQPGFSELIPTWDRNESVLVTASVGSYLVCNCHSVQLNIIHPPWDLRGGT